MAQQLSNADLLLEQSIPALEQYLEHQIKENTTDLRCNRALVRLYSIFPARANMDHTALALAKALVQHPEPEFMQLLTVVPEKSYTAAIKALVEVDQLLAGADWQRVWQRVEQADIAPLLAKVTGFADGIREYVFGAINRTYSRIDAPIFGASVHLAAGPAAAFASAHGCIAEGEELVLPSLPENSDRKTTKQVQLDLLRPQEVASILNLLTR